MRERENEEDRENDEIEIKGSERVTDKRKQSG